LASKWPGVGLGLKVPCCWPWPQSGLVLALASEWLGVALASKWPGVGLGLKVPCCWPWPQSGLVLALALKWPGVGLGLKVTCLGFEGVVFEHIPENSPSHSCVITRPHCVFFNLLCEERP